MSDPITRAKTRELETRVERLEEEMETARALIAQQIQFNLNLPKLDRAEWHMLLEMFAVIDEQQGLAGDMLELYNHLKREVPRA